MKDKINRLPHWVLTDLNPAFYDCDSATAIEQTAKIYAKVQELVDIYNKFVDEINIHIEEFEIGTNKSIEVFQKGIRQEFQDFIDIINLKVKDQDKIINNAVEYMKTNFVRTIRELLEEMKESGELDKAILDVLEELTNTTLIYNAKDESITIVNPLRPITNYDEETEELTIINIPNEEITEIIEGDENKNE